MVLFFLPESTMATQQCQQWPLNEWYFIVKELLGCTQPYHMPWHRLHNSFFLPTNSRIIILIFFLLENYVCVWIQVIVEIPYVLFQTTYYTLIVYVMVSFEWTVSKYLWFFFIHFFTFLYFTYHGLMAVSLTPNDQLASILTSAFYSLFNLFSGFFIRRPVIASI